MQQPEKVRAFATMPIGKIEAFDETNDDWNAYVEPIEQYFIANEIKEDKQVAVTLSLMGNKTYGLLQLHAVLPPQPSHPACLSRLYRRNTTEACVAETTAHSRAIPLSQKEPTRT